MQHPAFPHAKMHCAGDIALHFSFVISQNMDVLHTFVVIPSISEESTSWMLRFAQYDKSEDVIPNAVRNPPHGCFTTLRPVQHDSQFNSYPFLSVHSLN